MKCVYVCVCVCLHTHVWERRHSEKEREFRQSEKKQRFILVFLKFIYYLGFSTMVMVWWCKIWALGRECHFQFNMSKYWFFYFIFLLLFSLPISLLIKQRLSVCDEKNIDLLTENFGSCLSLQWTRLKNLWKKKRKKVYVFIKYCAHTAEHRDSAVAALTPDHNRLYTGCFNIGATNWL